MKQGANFVDKNRIKDLEAQGMSVAEISFQLRIAPHVVASFAPDADLGEEPEVVIEEDEVYIDPEEEVEEEFEDEEDEEED